MVSCFVFLLYFLLVVNLVVSTSAIDCLLRLISKMAYVLSGMLDCAHSVTLLISLYGK